MTVLLDHLWQSTLFAGALGLLTLAFRRNGAAVRYGLWFAASVKFLLPFSALVAIGGLVSPHVPPASPTWTALVRTGEVAQPFSGTHAVIRTSAARDLHLTIVLLAVWACGFLALTCVWVIRWSRLAAIVRDARDISNVLPLPVKASTMLLEPGLVGIWRPVLLLPEDILSRLSPRELDAIKAHERGHLRRMDNLTAAIHMLVTNLFWFHPLLWWMGNRLVEERERACDESVLGAGSDPKTYAESILKVCALTVQSSLLCAAGVSGANLKRRIETIMENRTMLHLNALQKSFLAAVTAIAIAVPVAIGSVHASDSAGAVPAQSPQRVKELLAEQRRPRTEIAFDPAQFDRFAGYYRLTATDVFVVSRRGNRYYVGVIGEPPDEMYPESDHKFFLKGLSLPAQFSFKADAAGRTTEMVLHQSGEEQHAPRIADSEGREAEAFLAHRIAANLPSAGTEDALRRQIDGLMSGVPDYTIMSPTLAAGTRQMLGDLHAKVATWGPLRSVKFIGVGKNGMDIYEVTCRNRRSKWDIAPLTPDGKISGIFFSEES